MGERVGVTVKVGVEVGAPQGSWVKVIMSPVVSVPAVLHSYWVNWAPVPRCMPTVALLPPWETEP